MSKFYLTRRVPTTLGYEIVKLGVKPAPCRLSPIPRFQSRQSFDCFNRLETCSNWKGMIPLIASRREYHTYRPKHVSLIERTFDSLWLVDVSLPETILCFYKPILYVIQFIYKFLYSLLYLFQTIAQFAQPAQPKTLIIPMNKLNLCPFYAFIRVTTC